MNMQRVKTTDGEEIPCPICDTTGFWLDDINKTVCPTAPRETCEFCGGSGYMMVLPPEIMKEGLEDEGT